MKKLRFQNVICYSVIFDRIGFCCCVVEVRCCNILLFSFHTLPVKTTAKDVFFCNSFLKYRLEMWGLFRESGTDPFHSDARFTPRVGNL